MSVRNESSRSGWLSIVNDKRSRIANLLGEIAGLGAPAAMKPSIFRKFLMLLSEVDSEKEKENDLLARIESLEEQHRFCRSHMQLEHADPAYALKFMDEENGNEMPVQRRGLWCYLRMWFGPEGHEIMQREQGLNND